MTTLNQLIDEVSLKLSGYTMRQDGMTYLASAINDTTTTLVLNSVDNVGQGIIEVDDELMYVTTVDRPSSTVTIAPFGRGYLGTTAVSHFVNARVTIMPSFPRHEIKNAINDTIRAVSPDIFGVGQYTFTANPAVITYSLPADTAAVMGVTYESIGPSKEWVVLRRWDFNSAANSTAFATGKSITVTQEIQPGRTVNVSYVKDATPLSASTDVFETVTGYPASCKDVIVLGSVYRLISMIEPGRVNYTTPEADYQQNGRVPFGSGTNTAKYIFALYQQRLNEEVKKLKSTFAVRVHYNR